MKTATTKIINLIEFQVFWFVLLHYHPFLHAEYAQHYSFSLFSMNNFEAVLRREIIQGHRKRWTGFETAIT